MAIFLTVLKIIGIVLLVILALVLLILIWVLVIPMFYSVDFNKEEGYKLKASAWFFLHIASINFIMEDGVTNLAINVFGIDINKIRNRKKEKENEEKAPKKVEKVEKTSNKKSSTNKEKIESKPVEKVVTESVESELKESKSVEKVVTESVESELIESKSVESESEKNVLIFDRVFDKINSTCDGFNKLLDKMDEIYGKITKAIDKVITKVDKLYDFVTSEELGVFLKYTWVALVNILKHIRPRKIKSDLVIGTGEPDTTGQLFGGIAVLFGALRIQTKVVPDFDNQVFKGWATMKGRMVLGYLGIILVKFYFSQEFKDFKKEKAKL